jgi:hypothetical protein
MFKFFNPAPAKKSVNDILTAFSQNITDLEIVREREIAKAEDLQTEAFSMTTRANEARAEAGRADVVALKLRSLIAG